MKIRSRLSKVEVQKIFELYALGCTVNRIAVELRRSESAVEAVVRRLGLSHGKSVSERMNSASAELRDQIANTYPAGNSTAPAATLLGTSRDVVIGEIGRCGIVRSRALAQRSAYKQGRGRRQSKTR